MSQTSYIKIYRIKTKLKSDVSETCSICIILILKRLIARKIVSALIPCQSFEPLSQSFPILHLLRPVTEIMNFLFLSLDILNYFFGILPELIQSVCSMFYKFLCVCNL
jgi:hypothetical protein